MGTTHLHLTKAMISSLIFSLMTSFAAGAEVRKLEAFEGSWDEWESWEQWLVIILSIVGFLIIFPMICFGMQCCACAKCITKPFFKCVKCVLCCKCCRMARSGKSSSSSSDDEKVIAVEARDVEAQPEEVAQVRASGSNDDIHPIKK